MKHRPVAYSTMTPSDQPGIDFEHNIYTLPPGIELPEGACALYGQGTVDAMQAKIDALMLEFCPDEMSEDQMETWIRNQVPA